MAHRLPIVLDVFADTPLYEQLAAELKRGIESGRLAAGEKLPSIRDLSRQLQLSKVTVAEAFNKLIAAGLIIAKPGSGNYVAGEAKTEEDEPVHAEVQFSLQHGADQFRELDAHITWGPEAERVTSALNEIPFHPWWQLDVEFEFRVGEPAVEFMRGAQFERAVEIWTTKYLSKPQKYSQAAGIDELRWELSNWLQRTRAIACRPEDLIITSGAQQARDLCARLLVAPGTKVVLEEPGSVTDALAYKAQGASIVHVAQDEHGIDVERLNNIGSAGVMHLMTAANFPTGACLSITRRQQVLDWAKRHNAVIVEDSYGAGYGYEEAEAPSLYQLGRQDEQPRVIYCGSLSQLFSPALRLGFAIVPPWLRRQYVQAKWLSDRHASLLTQQLSLALMQGGFFDEHHRKLLEAGRRRRKTLLTALSQWPSRLIRYVPVKAGFQQAIWFNEDIDDLLVYERALNQRIGVNPLALNYFSEEPKSGLSLNFVRMPEEAIAKGLEKLLEIIQQCRSLKV